MRPYHWVIVNDQTEETQVKSFYGDSGDIDTGSWFDCGMPIKVNERNDPFVLYDFGSKNNFW